MKVRHLSERLAATYESTSGSNKYGFQYYAAGHLQSEKALAADVVSRHSHQLREFAQDYQEGGQILAPDRMTMYSVCPDLGRCRMDHSLISFPARALPPFEVALPLAVLPVTAHL